MTEKLSVKSNRSIKDTLHVETKGFLQHRPIFSRPSTTFTSVPIKLINYHLSRPFNSRTKFLESIQKSTIICYRCKKLKPNTFLRESQVSQNKICICSQQIHSIKIQKPLEKKIIKQKSTSIDSAPFFAEGKSIGSHPAHGHRFSLELESHKSVCDVLNAHFLNRSNEPQKEPALKLRYLIFKGNNSELVKQAMKRREKWSEGYYSITSTVNFIWQPTSYGVKFDRLKGFLPVQVINHFEYHCELSNKINLFNNLVKHCSDKEISIQSLVPLTVVIEMKTPRHSLQIENFKANFNSLNATCPQAHYSGKGIWILKPSGFNRGRGIHIFNSLDMLDSILVNLDDRCNYVIQKYIESPMLFNHRKFDVRMWVLVTHDNSCYYFPEGYIRTASETYSISSNSLENKFMHLTNNAIQKEGEQYEKYEKGNQVSFEDFKEFLRDNYCYDTFEKILEGVVNMISISLSAVKEKLNPRLRKHCFEIFGYDFIIDSDLKPWLIEVNTNPCLELSSPLLSQIIPRMIEDALALTVDVLFPSTQQSPLETIRVISLSDENLWKFIIKI